MLSVVKGLLKRIFGADKTTTIEEPPAQEKTGFSIGHEWPFPSPEPPNAEYLVGELIKGVQVEGDHVFFIWGDQKRRHIRTTKGTETVLARNIVWWMEGRKVPSMANGLTTNCGEQKCIKLSHLILRMPQLVHGPEREPVKPVHVAKAKQPPLPPKVRPGSKTKLERLNSEDRLKCITRKAYFETKERADSYARELNKPEVRGKGRRQYSYPCTQGCGGFHLTKIDPDKYNKHKKKVGAW
jgi:hypothetical protein